MKVFKLLSLIILSALLVFAMVYCGDDDPAEPAAVTPTPTPCTGIVCGASTCDTEDPGDLCSILEKLEEYCIIPTDDPNLTEELIQGLVDDLNGFWGALATAMEGTGTFDSASVMAAFDEVLSDTNVTALTPLLLDLLTGLDMTSADTSMTCEDIASIGDYITQLTGSQPSCPATDVLWCDINSYVSLVGLDEATAWTIISTRVGELDTALNISNIVAHVDSTCTDPSTWVYTWLVDEASATDLEVLLYYVTHPTEVTDTDWEDFIDDVTSDGGLLDVAIETVVNLLGDIHDQGDADTIAGLIPTLPGLLMGMIDESMNACE